jgi:protein-tyrosine phosphatase
MSRQLLFLCTGNYYRSRFAELLFNHLAPVRGLPWQAVSRGIAIELGVDNVGPIARSTLAALDGRGVPLPATPRYPLALAEADLAGADHIVALKHDEHRPLLDAKFPGWAGRVEFWQVHDIDQALPSEALPQIEREVLALLERLGLGQA